MLDKYRTNFVQQRQKTKLEQKRAELIFSSSINFEFECEFILTANCALETYGT